MTNVIDLPQSPIATVREFVDNFSGKDMTPPAFTTSTYTQPLHQARQYFPTSFNSSTSDWENFKNELEFE